MNERIREIVGAYYRECYSSTPQKVPLAMKIAERIHSETLKAVGEKLKAFGTQNYNGTGKWLVDLDKLT